MSLVASGARAAWPPNGWRLHGETGSLLADGHFSYEVSLQRGPGEPRQPLPVPQRLLQALPAVGTEFQNKWAALAREFVADVTGRPHRPYLTFLDGLALRPHCRYHPFRPGLARPPRLTGAHAAAAVERQRGRNVILFNQPWRPAPLRRLVPLTLAGALVANLAWGAGLASAQGAVPVPAGCAPIATALTAPRFIAVADDNTVYVSEAGSGGTEVLTPPPGGGPGGPGGLRPPVA